MPSLRSFRLVLLAFATFGSATATAAPCAGFTDVDAASPFCQSVEWIRNRGVTLGCAASLYCPDDSVLRLSMAAFLRRLGAALTPQQIHVERASGFLFLDVPAVLCQTASVPIAGYPRRASIDVSFAGLANGDVDVAAALVMSSDGGVSWTPMHLLANRVTLPANQWEGASDLALVDVDVGPALRWGLRINRAAAGSANLLDTRCEMRVTLRSRDGAMAPF